MKKPRAHISTRVSLAPLTVDEALSALLKTPPPEKGGKSKQERKRKAVKKR